jgi:CspA family cold shock protein
MHRGVDVMRGRVKWFDTTHGYGYITGEDGRGYSVHWLVIQVPGCRTLQAGEVVEFEMAGDRRRIRAVWLATEA